MPTRKGRCLCGAVTYAFEDPVNWVAHCHCQSCRLNTGSPFTTFVGVPIAAFRWTGAEPAIHKSSPGVRRRFCSRCGTPVSYETDSLPDEIHLYLAATEDPSGLVPQLHVHAVEQVPWVTLGDDLPKYATYSDSPLKET